MKAELINHLENVLQEFVLISKEIETTQKQLYYLNTKLMGLQEEVLKLSGVSSTHRGTKPPNDTW